MLGLPKLTERLRTTLGEFEATHGPFLCEGARFLPAMEAMHAAYSAARREEKQRKAAARSGKSASSSSSSRANNNGGCGGGTKTPAKSAQKPPRGPPRAPLSPSNRNAGGVPRSAAKANR